MRTSNMTPKRKKQQEPAKKGEAIRIVRAQNHAASNNNEDNRQQMNRKTNQLI